MVLINDDKIYDIVKEYPDMFKIIQYKYGFTPPKNKDNNKELKKQIIDNDNIQRSVRRSRSIINDYVLSNDFDIFATFTFDPKRVDRYDLNAVYSTMQRWLWKQQQHSDGMLRYVIVPERHKDGALHFHALIGGLTTPLKKSNVIQNNKFVYNLPSFRSGFTNVQYLDDDKQKATAYLCKYITKDMALIHNRRRYWCSKNLRLPDKFYNKYYDIFGFNNRNLLTPHSLVYESDYNVMYEIKKKDLFV